MDELERVTRAICRETCAFVGEPPCFAIEGDNGEILPWPNPNCDEPGCAALAAAAIAMQKRPVAFRVKDFADGWILCHTEEVANNEAEEHGGALVQGLYVRDGQ